MAAPSGRLPVTDATGSRQPSFLGAPMRPDPSHSDPYASPGRLPQARQGQDVNGLAQASLAVGIIVWACGIGVLLTSFAPSLADSFAARAILVAAIFGIGSPIVVVLGHVAFSQIKRTGGSGARIAVAGLALGYLGVACLVIAAAFVAVGSGGSTGAGPGAPPAAESEIPATEAESALPGVRSDGPDDLESRAPIDRDAPVDGVPAEFAGTWEGGAVNQDGARFRLSVVFVEGRTTATARYRPMGCTGALRLIEGTRTRLEMSLRVESPCTDGTVSVTRRDEGSLVYAWRRPGTRYHYRATLWPA